MSSFGAPAQKRIEIERAVSADTVAWSMALRGDTQWNHGMLDAVLSPSKHAVFLHSPDLHFDGLSAALDQRSLPFPPMSILHRGLPRAIAGLVQVVDSHLKVG